jgi:hypothetical protein
MTRMATHIVLGTGHITQAINDDIEVMKDPEERYGDWRDDIDVCQYLYGYWIRVPRPDPTDPNDHLEDRIVTIPTELAACLRHAHAMGAAWILFDRDEPEIEDLPWQDW